MLLKGREKKGVTDCAILLIVALLLMFPMCNPQIDIYLDDGSQHLMRAYHTYQSILQKGNSNIISSFANGFGYSWNLFYGPLSTDCIMLMGIIFGNFNLGFKVVIGMVLWLASLFMYQFVKEVTENRNTALLAGIIYSTSPYFLTDIYVRHAIRRMFCLCFYTNGISRTL